MSNGPLDIEALVHMPWTELMDVALKTDSDDPAFWLMLGMIAAKLQGDPALDSLWAAATDWDRESAVTLMKAYRASYDETRNRNDEPEHPQ